MDLTVLYSNSSDNTPPTISSLNAEIVGSAVSFVAEAADDSPATVTDFVILFRDASGLWKQVQLVQTPSTNIWTGSAPVTGTQVQVIGQAVDDAGNVGLWANKGEPLIVTPPPPPPDGVSVDLDGPPGLDGWFLGDVTVTLNGPEGLQFDVSVNGGSFAPYSGPFIVGDEGSNRVLFTTSDGGSGEVTVPIDETDPVITIAVPPNGAKYRVNQQVASNYSCTDGGSGVGSCAGPVPSGSNISTTAGAHTFTVNSSDRAGNTASLTHNYSAEYSFFGFFPPVKNPPALNETKAGQSGSGVPFKWRLFAANGVVVRNLSAVSSISSQQINCTTRAMIGTALAESRATLQYDQTGDQYLFNWKTKKAWAGTCRRLTFTFDDGSQRFADFKFK
jgi:hypothetical protein